MARLLDPSVSPQYITGDTSIDFVGVPEWTIAVWLKWSGNGRGIIVCRANPTADQWQFALDVKADGTIEAFAVGSFFYITNSPPITPDEWHLIVFRRLGGGFNSIDLRVDGVQADNQAVGDESDTRSFSDSLIIGAWDDLGDPLDGKLSRVAIWVGTSLSDTDADALLTASPDTLSTAPTFYTIGPANELVDYGTGGITLTNNGTTYDSDEPFPSGGSTYTLDASGVGDYDVTGTSAGLRLGRRVAAASASYVITGTVTTLRRAARVTAASTSYVLTGTAATLRRALGIIAASVVYTLTGATAALRRGLKIGANSTAYTLTGTAANLHYSGASSTYTLDATTSGTYTLTGTTAILKRTYVLAAQTSARTVTGSTAGTIFNRKLIAAVATLVLTGTVATLRRALRITASTVSVIVTGSTALLDFGRHIIAGSGAYSLTSTAANTRVGRVVGADSATYSITSVQANLIYSGAPATYTLSAASGSLTTTGTAATLMRTYVVIAVPSSYGVTGQTSALRPARRLTAASDSVSLTGQQARLATTRALLTVPAGYSIVQNPASLYAARKVSGGTVAYTVIGSDAELHASAEDDFRTIIDVTGSFSTMVLSGIGTYGADTDITGTLEA